MNLAIGVLVTGLLWHFGVAQRVFGWNEAAGWAGIRTRNWIDSLKIFILVLPPIVAFVGLWQLVSGRGFVRLLLLWDRLPYWIQVLIGLAGVAVVLGIAALFFQGQR